jgi:hypothetical protein
MLIALEDLNTEDTGSEFVDCEAAVDLEGELFIAMEDIDRLREKKRKQKHRLVIHWGELTTSILCNNYHFTVVQLSLHQNLQVIGKLTTTRFQGYTRGN